MLTAGGYHRNCSPSLYGQGSTSNTAASKSDTTLFSHPLHRGHEKKIVYKPPLPPVVYPLGFPRPFPEMGRTGSFQSPAYDAEEIKLSVSNYFPIKHIFSKIPSMDQMQPWRSQKLDHSCCHYYLYSASPAKMEIPYPNRNMFFLEIKHPLLSHASVLITMAIITCHYVTVRDFYILACWLLYWGTCFVLPQ